MLDPNLSKDEADAIYESPKCVSDETISWGVAENGAQRINFEVIMGDNTPLVVHGWLSRKGKKRYGFSLVFKNSIPIRRWDDRPGHPDPCSKKTLMAPHKHYYCPEYDDACAYETSDIRLGDVNGALWDFLKECNISMGNAIYQEIIT